MTRTVDSLRIENPCAASWAEMDGTGGQRFCRLCSKVVTDVTSLTACELEKMLAQPEKPCLRVHRDGAGRVLTFDRLAAAVFVGLAGCAPGFSDSAFDSAPETAAYGVEEAPTRPMGTGERPADDRDALDLLAEMVEKARTETPRIEVAQPPPPPMTGGVAYHATMGEPAPYEPEAPTMGKIAYTPQE